jgi:hypothetical protein
MRRIAGFVLLGLGAFLLAMAGLLKWYAYPTLAVVPLDQDSVTISTGEGMTYFSAADRVEKTDTLTSTLRTIGDVKAAEDQGDNVAVWDKSTVTTTSDGTVISAGTIRVGFDRNTAEAVNCCDENTDDEPTEFKGLTFKFPFDTQKHSYDFWDDDLGKAVAMQYDGIEKIDGLTTYRFTQTIEPTQIGTINLPSSVLGETPGSMLSAEEWYGNQRTYWAEPETGVIIDAEENPNSTFKYNGEERVVATRGTTGYDDDQVQANIDEYKSKAGQLHLVRSILPLAGLILGLVLLLAGAAVVALRRSRESGAPDAAASGGGVRMDKTESN